jgi:hypothetical protein
MDMSRLMERMPMVGVPGQVGRLRQEQIAQQSTWTRVPDSARLVASMHIVHIVPSNGSTETWVNPTDPGDECYMERPSAKGTVVPAGRMRY